MPEKAQLKALGIDPFVRFYILVPIIYNLLLLYQVTENTFSAEDNKKPPRKEPYKEPDSL